VILFSKRIVVGAGTLKLIHRDVASVLELEHWVAMLGLDPGKFWIHEGVVKVE
jgi:hypothetical protein